MYDCVRYDCLCLFILTSCLFMIHDMLLDLKPSYVFIKKKAAEVPFDAAMMTRSIRKSGSSLPLGRTGLKLLQKYIYKTYTYSNWCFLVFGDIMWVHGSLIFFDAVAFITVHVWHISSWFQNTPCGRWSFDTPCLWDFLWLRMNWRVTYASARPTRREAGWKREMHLEYSPNWLHGCLSPRLITSSQNWTMCNVAALQLIHKASPGGKGQVRDGQSQYILFFDCPLSYFLLWKKQKGSRMLWIQCLEFDWNSCCNLLIFRFLADFPATLLAPAVDSLVMTGPPTRLRWWFWCFIPQKPTACFWGETNGWKQHKDWAQQQLQHLVLLLFGVSIKTDLTQDKAQLHSENRKDIMRVSLVYSLHNDHSTISYSAQQENSWMEWHSSQLKDEQLTWKKTPFGAIGTNRARP